MSCWLWKCLKVGAMYKYLAPNSNWQIIVYIPVRDSHITGPLLQYVLLNYSQCLAVVVSMYTTVCTNRTWNPKLRIPRTACDFVGFRRHCEFAIGIHVGCACHVVPTLPESPQHSWWGLVLAETCPTHWVTCKVTSRFCSCLGSCSSLIVSCSHSNP